MKSRSLSRLIILRRPSHRAIFARRTCRCRERADREYDRGDGGRRCRV